VLKICIECPRVQRVQRDILQTMTKKCLHTGEMTSSVPRVQTLAWVKPCSTREKGNRPHYAESSKGEHRYVEGVSDAIRNRSASKHAACALSFSSVRAAGTGVSPAPREQLVRERGRDPMCTQRTLPVTYCLSEIWPWSLQELGMG